MNIHEITQNEAHTTPWCKQDGELLRAAVFEQSQKSEKVCLSVIFQKKKSYEMYGKLKSSMMEDNSLR